MAYKAMLLPDAIPTISKKAVKAPAKKRGALLKRERLRVSGHLVILPCTYNPVHFRAKRHVHTMLTVSVFTA